METRMTDNEIIKALECCNGYDCETCRALKYCDYTHPGPLARASLDLINRQKELINGLIAGQETLQKHLTDKQGLIEKFEKIEHFATKTIDTQHAEIDRLKHRKIELQIRNQELQHEKSEAIKEFAERLKSKLQWDTEFDNMLVFETDIDNLVKEMTEVETNQRNGDEGK